MVPKFIADIKDEFRLANFKFHWKSRDDFEQPGWKCLLGIKYVFIRWILAIYFIVAISISLAETGKDSWIFLLTSINYIAVTMYFLLSAIFVTYYVMMTSRSNNQSVTPDNQTSSEEQRDTSRNTHVNFCMKMHWFLHNLAMNSCTFIVVAFWLMIAPSREGGYAPSMRTYLVVDRHGINLLLLVIDVFVHKIPVRLLHCIYPSIFIGLYFVYNSIYWSITKNLVYGEMLNYATRPGTITGLALGAMFIACPFIQFLWYFAYVLKKKFLIKRKEDPNENCEMQSLDSNCKV